MNQADLERVYETVATGIDAVGSDNAEVFLAKLVLLLSQEIGDADRVLVLVAEAQGDPADG